MRFHYFYMNYETWLTSVCTKAQLRQFFTWEVSSIKYSWVRINILFVLTEILLQMCKWCMCRVERIAQKLKTKWLRCDHLDTEGPHDRLCTHTAECTFIAETILMLHHQVSKTVRGDTSRRELCPYCTALSVALNYNPRLRQLFDHPSQRVAISSRMILLPA